MSSVGHKPLPVFQATMFRELLRIFGGLISKGYRKMRSYALLVKPSSEMQERPIQTKKKPQVTRKREFSDDDKDVGMDETRLGEFRPSPDESRRFV